MSVLGTDRGVGPRGGGRLGLAGAGLVLLAALAAGCDSPVETGPAVSGGLELRISDFPTGSVVDAGLVRIRGAATRNVTINPGETKEIELAPGTYSVALEGLSAGAVETFGRQDNVLVREGQFTTVSLNMQSFVPQFTDVPEQVPVGQDFSVSWSPVSHAASYDLVVATDPNFSTVVRSDNTGGTSFTLALQEAGNHFFQVRARNEFNSLGVFSEVSGDVLAVAQPRVVRHVLEFIPATPESCPPGNQAFAMIETVEYDYPDGDFPTTDFNENSERIESQLRDQGESVWLPVIPSDPGRRWSVMDGSDGGHGELLSGICFAGREEADFIDFRVRLFDTDGVEGPWSEMTLWLPKRVEASDRQNLGFDESVRLEATAFDVNDDPVPGDPVTWSQFNLGVGLVEPDGAYTTRSSGGGGLDQVYARAAYAWTNVPIQGPEAGRFRSWWAPCWAFDNPGLTLPKDAFRPFRMQTYVGQEYLIELEDPTDGTTPSGDADLYLRSDEAPTRDVYDDRSASLRHVESLTFLADREHTLWFAVDAWTDIANIRLDVTTTDGLCGYPGNGIDPAAAAGAAPAQAGTALSTERLRALVSARPSPGRRASPAGAPSLDSTAGRGGSAQLRGGS